MTDANEAIRSEMTQTADCPAYIALNSYNKTHIHDYTVNISHILNTSALHRNTDRSESPSV